MRHAAGENKDTEANEHPIEGQITPLPNEIKKGKWNDQVGTRDQKIRNEMEPHQTRIPQVTMALRQKTVLAKETLEKFHPSRTNFAANAIGSFIPQPFARQSLIHGTASTMLQTVLSRHLRHKLKKRTGLFSYGELCKC
jgi:hypothetical protein